MTHQSNLIAQNIEEYLAQHERKELLRFITCGSVDDGKSTLIGRLFYDSKMIAEDQLAAITRDSVTHGTTGGGFDPARIAVYPTVQLESFTGAHQPCVDTAVIDVVKQFYNRNLAAGVPFAIGLSTYPASERNGLDNQRSQLLQLRC